MTFGDLKTKSGLEALNAYLENKSYIEGYVLCMYISSDLIDSSFPRVKWKRLDYRRRLPTKVLKWKSSM